MWSLKKMTQMNLFTKQKQIRRHRNKFMIAIGEGGGRDKLGVWD